MLTLKRASKSRASGEWSVDDYDVLDGNRHIGRILWTHAEPKDRRWFWTITARVPQYVSCPYCDAEHVWTVEEARIDDSQKKATKLIVR